MNRMAQGRLYKFQSSRHSEEIIEKRHLLAIEGNQFLRVSDLVFEPCRIFGERRDFQNLVRIFNGLLQQRMGIAEESIGHDLDEIRRESLVEIRLP